MIYVIYSNVHVTKQQKKWGCHFICNEFARKANYGSETCLLRIDYVQKPCESKHECLCKIASMG